MNKMQYMIKNKKWIALIFIQLSTLSIIFAQVDTSFKRTLLPYQTYMEMVMEGNLDYIYEKYNVKIADAKIEAAKVFQNPSFALDLSRDKEGNSIPGYSFSGEFSKTFELGQKRKARIDLAKSESQLTNALLTSFFRNLQADATLDYLTALKEDYLFNVMLNSYKTMKELADADSIRLSLGMIMSIDAAQSKIEAGILFNDLMQKDADRNNSFLKLSIQTSSFYKDTVYMPNGKFDNPLRIFILSDLLTTALNNRADLWVAKSNMNFSQKQLVLTKKERIMDIDFKIGTSNSYFNSRFSAPTSTAIYTGIAIPLKFSNFNKGEIKMAQYQVEQSELQYKQIEIKIQNEVIQAYNQYISLYKQVDNYKHGLLDQAEIVLNGKVYSYSRGETSLLEVLNAQRTYNNLQTSYYETLYNCYAALIELERSVGIWDIDL